LEKIKTNTTTKMLRYITLLLIGAICSAGAVGKDVLAMKAFDNYTLTLIAEPTEGGLLSGGGIYPGNIEVEISATAEPGFRFLIWTDQNGEVISELANFTFMMPENDVELTAHFVCAPDWTQPENLQFNMQVLAKIIIDGEVSFNPGDILGAFVGDECRGVGYPLPQFEGLIFLTVASNVTSGEIVDLRIWNSAICESCGISQSFEFESQSQLGTLDSPLILECSDEIALEINFNQGYTWFSLNVEQYNMSPNVLFSDLSPCYNDRIIGQHSFTVYSGEQWVGSLTDLSHMEMYRMRLCSAQNVLIVSNHAPNSVYQLPAGSTWLSYRPEVCLTVNEALANLTPEPAYNDRVLGQNAFALYNGSQWIGSLTQMCPGKGYILKLSNESALTYPIVTNKNQFKESIPSDLNSPIGELPAGNKQHSMMLVGKLIMDGIQSKNPADVVYAYIDGELRGMASPLPEFDGKLFMSIGEDQAADKEVYFRVWLDDLGQFADIIEETNFLSMAEAGTLDNPFKMNVNEQKLTTEPVFIGNPFPNPFAQNTSIDLYITENTQLTYSIINQMGQVQKLHTESFNSIGKQQIHIDKDNLVPGTYSIVIKLIGDGQFHQVSRVLVVQ
jgi:hypothetical protein